MGLKSNAKWQAVSSGQKCSERHRPVSKISSVTWKLQGRLWSHDKSRPVSTAVLKEQCHNSRGDKLTTVTTEITNSRKPRTAKISKKKKNKTKQNPPSGHTYVSGTRACSTADPPN